MKEMRTSYMDKMNEEIMEENKKLKKEKRILQLLLITTGVASAGAMLFLFRNKGIQNDKIIDLVKTNAIINNENNYNKKRCIEMEKTIYDMKDLCFEKDMFVLELASDALRHGSPKGGEIMASWKNFLKENEAYEGIA